MCLAKDIKERRFLGGNPNDLFIFVFVISSFNFDLDFFKIMFLLIMARRKFLIRRDHVLTNKYFCDF